MTDFARFAADNGLIVRHVIADGQVHRVPTTLHPRKKNGAYQFDGDSGWVQAWDMHEQAIAFRDSGRESRPVTPRPVVQRPDTRKEREAAAAQAEAIVKRSILGSHPYLSRKGFPAEQGLVDTDGRLVIPMRDARHYADLRSVQRIDDEGAKLFLKGGAAKDAVYRIGRGRVVLVEGYATGLTVRAAFELLYEKVCIVVCFSAGNMVSVARLYPGAIVIADNDASGTGARAAESTGLRWVMPDEVGMDANDLMLRDGVRAVCELVRRI